MRYTIIAVAIALFFVAGVTPASSQANRRQVQEVSAIIGITNFSSSEAAWAYIRTLPREEERDAVGIAFAEGFRVIQPAKAGVNQKIQFWFPATIADTAEDIEVYDCVLNSDVRTGPDYLPTQKMVPAILYEKRGSWMVEIEGPFLAGGVHLLIARSKRDGSAVGQALFVPHPPRRSGGTHPID